MRSSSIPLDTQCDISTTGLHHHLNRRYLKSDTPTSLIGQNSTQLDAECLHNALSSIITLDPGTWHRPWWCLELLQKMISKWTLVFRHVYVFSIYVSIFDRLELSGHSFKGIWTQLRFTRQDSNGDDQQTETAGDHHKTTKYVRNEANGIWLYPT